MEVSLWNDLRPRAVSAQQLRFQERDALRVELLPDVAAGIPDVDYVDMPTFVELPIEFRDGVVEVDVYAELNGLWPEGARGFAGLAYRIQADAAAFECVYLRPSNGRRAPRPRQDRAIQYFTYPDFRFDRLRNQCPGCYEAGADIDIDEWIRLRLEVHGRQVRALVNDVVCLDLTQTLIADQPGTLGLFVDIGTVAYFADLRVSDLH